MSKKALIKKKNIIRKKIVAIATWCWATLPRRIVSCLVIAGILLSSFWFLLLRPKPAEAGWWDEDWLYRQPVSISVHDAAETDVYIIITDVDTSDTDKFQADCGDLRFTKLDGTLLDYYIDSGSRGGDIVVHVLFDTFPAGAQTIYYYFGNPSADNGFKLSGFSTVATQNYIVDAINTDLEKKGTGPVLWLRFDEGYGTTAFDSSEQGNDGTITDATWTNSGKFDKALDFDTPGDLVTVTQSASINLSGKTAYSISAWIYPHSDGGSHVGEIIDKGANTYIRVDSEGADGYLDVEGKLDLDGTDANLNIADAIRVNRWSHIVMTYDDDDDDEITIYINGINMGTSVDSGIGSPAGDSGSNLLIGGDANATFDGIIDEVKIYPYARSAAQVKRNYNQGAAARIGRDDSWITDGLVGYWKMDEASWDGSANEVKDSSGAGNHGVRVDGADTGSGKFGKGGVFDGSGDYVNAGSDASLNITENVTISAWINLADNSNAYRTIVKRGHFSLNYNLHTYGSKLIIEYRDEDHNPQKIDVVVLVDEDTWYHVVGTISYNGTDSNLTLYVNGNKEKSEYKNGKSPGEVDFPNVFIGSSTFGGDDWNGSIDDLRIYNRALSEFEVRRLYDWGPPPVAEYKFDEYSGATAYDTSENSNDGTLNGPPTWESAADCKYGSCLEFDGDEDDVNAGDDASLDITENLTISAWIKTNTVENDYRTIVKKGIVDISYEFSLYGDDLIIGYDNLSTAMQKITKQGAVTAGTWYHVVGTKKLNVEETGFELELYVNGVSVLSDDKTGLTISPVLDPNLYIGGAFFGAWWDGAIDDVKIYNYVRTQKQIIEDMMGGRPAITETTSSPGAMAGYWKFDEGYGTTAYDASGRGNDLILSNDTESFAMAGKFGMAWDGDGTEYLYRADDPDFDFTATENFTISMWFRSDSADNPGSNEYLVNKGPPSAAGYAIYMNANGDVIFGVDDDVDWTPDDTAGNVGRDFYDNTWHHLAAIKTDTSSIAMFVDGIEISTDTSISAQGDLTNNATLYLGAQDDSPDGDEFNGDIDEVKIYRFALSPEEILLDYNKGKSVMMGAVGTEDDGATPSWSQDRAYCPPGFTGTCDPPVAEWKMDEMEDNTCRGGTNDVCDTSANTNDGALVGDTAWKGAADCKYGSCLEFDGDGDYVSLTSTITFGSDDNWTISFWARMSEEDSHGMIMGDITTTQDFIWFSPGSYLRFCNNENTDSDFTSVQSFDTLTFYTLVANGTELELYLNGAFEAKNTVTTSFIINTIGTGYTGTFFDFDGTIDDIKIFNYALTQEQISWLYDKGKPVGHWKFDEGEGSIAYDSSVNNNSGILGGDGQGTDVPTWTTSGKYNSALIFDGGEDYIEVANDASLNITKNITLSVWAKKEADSSYAALVRGGEGSDIYSLQSRSETNQWRMWISAGGSNKYAYSSAGWDSNWHHIVGTYDGETIRIYVDGIEGTSESQSGDIDTTAETFNIGGWTGAGSSLCFTGIIDEVKVYNYALTAEQIKIDYNQGAALRFGD